MIMNSGYGYIKEGFNASEPMFDMSKNPFDYSGCASLDEACFNVYLESMNDYDVFEDALIHEEMRFIRENGVEPIYEADAIKDIIDAAIEAIKNWGYRMYALIDRFMKEVASKIQLARTKIFKGNKEKFKAGKWDSGWDFSDNDYSAAAGIGDRVLIGGKQFQDAVAQTKKENKEKYGTDTPTSGAFFDSIVDVMNDWKIKSDKLTPDNEDVASAIRSEITVKKIKEIWCPEITINAAYVKSTKPYDVINKGYAEGLKAVKKSRDGVTKTVNGVMKELLTLKRNAKDKDEKSAFNDCIKLTKMLVSVNNVLVSAKLSILMGWLNQAYKICGIMYRSQSKIGKTVNDVQTTAGDIAYSARAKAGSAADSMRDRAKRVGDAMMA